MPQTGNRKSPNPESVPQEKASIRHTQGTDLPDDVFPPVLYGLKNGHLVRKEADYLKEKDDGKHQDKY